ncbi:DUF3040 domain-containing protein [Acidimicrobium ferrooxidans]|uniref:DUF3040 domain-containing protein n=1 Tax=Acidimicrobium ferrooxidans TaxID=53635 RepID=A0ABS3ANY6_9ACTN|nr:DUF3040 domain-containing protein [Acidimicrobium ferrooxidans]
MPLSENEQRILQEIEQDFYESDPDFAREVGETTLYRHSWRTIKWALFGVVVGVGLLIAALSFHFVLSFVGFLLIFGSVIIIERNARKLGRAGLAQVTGNIRATSVRDVVGGIGDKARQRRNDKDGKDS